MQFELNMCIVPATTLMIGDPLLRGSGQKQESKALEAARGTWRVYGKHVSGYIVVPSKKKKIGSKYQI